MKIKQHLSIKCKYTALVVLFSVITWPVHSEPFNENKGVEVTEYNLAYSQAELAQLLAPIALYPDTLLTQILIAATYPLEVVEAHRWLDKHQHLSATRLSQKVEKQPWDISVKSLTSFPRVLQTMNDDLTWLQNIGNAFLESEANVLDSIQHLRQQAENAGNLDKMDNVVVVRDKQAIIIESISPDIIYVPYYDTHEVYGRWHWRNYPPVFWHRPVHYSFSYGPFYWQRGVHVSLNFAFGAFHWHNRHVVIHHHKKYRSARQIVKHRHAKRWLHNYKHRRGVAYRSHHVKERYAKHRAKHTHMYKSAHRKQHKNVINNHKVHKSHTNKHLVQRNSNNTVKQRAMKDTQRKVVKSHSHKTHHRLNKGDKKEQRFEKARSTSHREKMHRPVRKQNERYARVKHKYTHQIQRKQQQRKER